MIRVDPVAPDRALLAPAADRLRAGGLVAFPTETVYGLGANALDPDAVRRVFDAKGRPSTDPLIVHVAAFEAVDQLVSAFPEAARALAARFWPGPLTLVLPRSAAVPGEVTAGLNTVAVRMPSHPVAHALLELAGVPVAAPSANLFSRPSPTRATHVLDDLNGRIDIVVDGGPTNLGIESTVVDLTGDVPVVLRPGAVTLEMLRKVVPTATMRDTLLENPASTGGDAGSLAASMPSPGMLDKHYSPRAPMTLYEGAGAVDAIVGRRAARSESWPAGRHHCGGRRPPEACRGRRCGRRSAAADRGARAGRRCGVRCGPAVCRSAGVGRGRRGPHPGAHISSAQRTGRGHPGSIASGGRYIASRRATGTFSSARRRRPTGGPGDIPRRTESEG